MTKTGDSAASSTGVRGRWQATTIAGGIVGSVVASFCCLPAAVAVALGLSLSTAAAFSQLIAFQRYFQVAGLAIAALAAWWVLRRSRKTCSVLEEEHRRKWVLLYVLGAFAIGMVALNLGIIPLLEQLPWLMS